MAISSSKTAYAATVTEAHEIVRACIKSIVQRIGAGEVTRDSLSETISEECNDSLIYTVSQYICVWGLRDETDAIEEGLSVPANFGEALAAQAFCNLESAVSSRGEEDFEAALVVREDQEAESAPSKVVHRTVKGETFSILTKK